MTEDYKTCIDLVDSMLKLAILGLRMSDKIIAKIQRVTPGRAL